MKTLDHLCAKYQNGNEQAFRAIYQELHKLAAHLAKDYSPTYGVDKHDLKQEALVAVWKCAKTWDRTRGVPFKSYAIKHMKWAIRNASKRKGQKHSVCREITDVAADNSIECKVELEQLYARMTERERNIVEGLSQGLTQAEIGAKMGLTAARISQLLKGMKSEYA